QISPLAHGGLGPCHRLQTQDTQFAEHCCDRELGGAPRGHLVPSPQESSHAIIDVVIDRPKHLESIPAAEVFGPTSQYSIEAIPNFRPRSHVPRHPHGPHFLPQPRHALFRRTFPNSPMTSLPKMVWPEGVSQKVEP